MSIVDEEYDEIMGWDWNDEDELERRPTTGAVDLPYAPFQNVCPHCNGIGGCSSSCPTQANH